MDHSLQTGFLKILTRFEVNDSDKHSSLLRYGISYGCKKFCSSVHGSERPALDQETLSEGEGEGTIDLLIRKAVL